MPTTRLRMRFETSHCHTSAAESVLTYVHASPATFGDHIMTSHLPSLVTVAAFLASATPAYAVPGAGKVVSEAIEWAFRKGGTVAAERASSRAATEAVEAGVRSGASATARTLATLETKAAGSSAKVLATFGTKGVAEIAEHAAAADIPRLLVYAERADTPATRDLLLEMYRKEGGALFRRIPPGDVLAYGLTAAALYGVHRGTAPMAAMGSAIANHPDMARDAAEASVRYFWMLGAALVVLLLWRHGQMPWHREPRVKDDSICRTETPRLSPGGVPAATASPR